MKERRSSREGVRRGEDWNCSSLCRLSYPTWTVHVCHKASQFFRGEIHGRWLSSPPLIGSRVGGGDGFVSFRVQVVVETDPDGAHASFSSMCMRCFCFQIVGPRLPMDPQSEALFTETSDGLILCKLINLAEFDTIDPRYVGWYSSFPRVASSLRALYRRGEEEGERGMLSLAHALLSLPPPLPLSPLFCRCEVVRDGGGLRNEHRTTKVLGSCRNVFCSFLWRLTRYDSCEG